MQHAVLAIQLAHEWLDVPTLGRLARAAAAFPTPDAVVAYSACATRAVLVHGRSAKSAPGAPDRQRPACIARSSLASLGSGVKIGIAFFGGVDIDIDFQYDPKL